MCMCICARHILMCVIIIIAIYSDFTQPLKVPQGTLWIKHKDQEWYSVRVHHSKAVCAMYKESHPCVMGGYTNMKQPTTHFSTKTPALWSEKPELLFSEMLPFSYSKMFRFTTGTVCYFVCKSKWINTREIIGHKETSWSYGHHAEKKDHSVLNARTHGWHT